MKRGQYALGSLRIVLGWFFLWAFFDKLFGLGFATKATDAWLAGVSPTAGFLKFGTHGPLAPFYQSLAGSAIVDWLFMLGLLFLGISLFLGIFMRLACCAGVVLMLLMWSSLLPPEHNPIVDEHIIYSLVMITLLKFEAGKFLGLGVKWSKSWLVRKYRFLE